MKSLLNLLAIVLTLLVWNNSYAQVATVKGVGTVTYTGFAGSNDRDKAYQKAQIAAVERYFAEKGEAESENFQSNQDKIIEKLDDFILSTSVLNEQDQSNLRKYTVAVKVEINEAKLRNIIRTSSVASGASRTEKSKVVFIFVGREAASTQSFDARVVKRKDVSAANDVGVSRSADGTESESVTERSSTKTETGGSVTRKADQTVYRVLPLADQRSAITSVFSQSGFKVIDSDIVLSDENIAAITGDYSSGNDLQPSTIRGLYKSLRENGVPIFVLATLTLGSPSTDPSSGMQRASIRLAARAMDVNEGAEIASVPPINQFGLGATNEDATNKALKEGAIAAAREVVSRLNAIGTK